MLNLFNNHININKGKIHLISLANLSRSITLEIKVFISFKFNTGLQQPYKIKSSVIIYIYLLSC